MNSTSKMLVAPLMALAVAFGSLSVPTPAEAGRSGRVAAGVAGAIIGLGVLGAIAHANDRPHHYRRHVRECYEGPERCGYTERRCHYNSWGDYVCRRGEYRCWRDTVCE